LFYVAAIGVKSPRESVVTRHGWVSGVRCRQ